MQIKLSYSSGTIQHHTTRRPLKPWFQHTSSIVFYSHFLFIDYKNLNKTHCQCKVCSDPRSSTGQSTDTQRRLMRNQCRFLFTKKKKKHIRKGQREGRECRECQWQAGNHSSQIRMSQGKSCAVLRRGSKVWKKFTEGAAMMDSRGALSSLPHRVCRLLTGDRSPCCSWRALL